MWRKTTPQVNNPHSSSSCASCKSALLRILKVGFEDFLWKTLAITSCGFILRFRDAVSITWEENCIIFSAIAQLGLDLAKWHPQTEHLYPPCPCPPTFTLRLQLSTPNRQFSLKNSSFTSAAAYFRRSFRVGGIGRCPDVGLFCIYMVVSVKILPANPQKIKSLIFQEQIARQDRYVSSFFIAPSSHYRELQQDKWEEGKYDLLMYLKVTEDQQWRRIQRMAAVSDTSCVSG